MKKGQVGLGLRFMGGVAFLVVIVFVFSLTLGGCSKPDLIIKDVSSNFNLNSDLVSFMDSKFDGIKIIEYVKLNEEKYDDIVLEKSKVFEEIYFSCYSFEIKDINTLEGFEVVYPVSLGDSFRFASLKVSEEFFSEDRYLCGGLDE